MSCQKIQVITSLCMIAFTSFFNLCTCSSQTDFVGFAEEQNAPDVNCGKRNNPRASREDDTGDFGHRNFTAHGPSLQFAKTNCSEDSELSSSASDSAEPPRRLSAEQYETPLSPTDLLKVGEMGRASASKRTVDLEESPQTDFQGLEERGKMSSSFDVDHWPSAWQAMRPSVQCQTNFMTLTLTGPGYLNLLVDRVDASPISVFQLPPHCGYLVQTTDEDLQLLAPYESCYVTQQSGRYVLPLVWLGSPVKVSCPIQASHSQPPFSHAPLTVRCLDFGMTIWIPGGKNPMCDPGVKVNGVWVPLVSDECAHPIEFHSEASYLYCPFTAPCFIHQNGAYLHLLIDRLEYLLSCPLLLSVPPHLPYLPLIPPLPPAPVTPRPRPNPPPPLPPSSTSAPGWFFAQNVPLIPFQHPDPPFNPPVPVLYPPLNPPPGTWSAHPSMQSTKPPPVDLVEPHYYQVSCPPNCKYPYRVPVSYPFIKSQDPDEPQPDRPTASTVTQTQGPKIFPIRRKPLPPLPVTPTHSASLQCLEEQLIAELPYAQLDSIEVKDNRKMWTPISSSPVDCGYVVKRVPSFGVTFVSPLPACHSYALSPMTLILSLRYLDVKLTKHRILELQCPNPSASSKHVPPVPAISSTAQPRTRRPVPPDFRLFCSAQHMRMELSPGPMSGIVVKDIKGSQMRLVDAPKHCGYSARRLDDGRINLFLPFNSCHMTVEGDKHKMNVVHIVLNGKRREARLSCPVSITVPSQECQVPSEQRLPCGSGALAEGECLSLGCCSSLFHPSCYHSMDKCTADRHFVFSVSTSLTGLPLSAALLVAAGDDSCTPQRVSQDQAVFKIPLEGCGTHRYEVANTVIYLQEVIHKAKLNHSSQTQDSPIRLMVECRYTPGSGSVGHLFKSPTLGPSIQTEGVFGVQLRIATDAQYTDFYPQNHRPLQTLLGKPLYLEVRLLNPPDPSVLLQVHYCVAYDLSRRSTWVLFYKGCLDSQQMLPQDHTRRFTIDTFQFPSKSKVSDADEEIYFMCSAQVCSPKDGPCVEGCFSR